MNDDADPQEPEEEPAASAGDADPVEPPPDPEPEGTPLWTVFLLPISILIGAAVIVAAILAADARSSPPDTVTPALNELATAVASLSAEVQSLSRDVESLRSAAAEDRRTLRDAIDGYAASLGLDAARFDACLAADATYDAIREHLQLGVDLGVNGTPTFFINNKMITGAQSASIFAAVIAAELDGSPTSIDEYPDLIRQLAETDPPRFVILPERPDASGAPIEGRADAPVVIVEFSDFQCPYCQRWYVDTLPDIRSRVGEEVAIAFFHFPLTRSHPNAAMAHAAAECAGNQGKFWEMHDLLFERQGEWSRLPNTN